MFGLEEAEYLFLKPVNHTLLADPTVMKALKSCETLICNLDVQSSLVIIILYRIFIQNCAKITKPSAELTKAALFDNEMKLNDP